MAEGQNDERILAEAQKLPISDRVAHGNWKVRSAAYEEIASVCGKTADPTHKIFAEYGEDRGPCNLANHGWIERHSPVSWA